MANEFKHKDVGDELSKAEWEGADSHEADSQAAGDIIYCDGSYWKRVGKGANGLYLKCSSAPYWEAILEGDIPAAIARDSEVTADIATHAALNTGAHGVGANYIAESSVDALDLAAHKTRHQNGGSDELSVAGLSGELADDQPPKAHKTSHQNGGSDEISVAGLSGELADDQPPKTHTHDEIIDADSDTKIQVEESADEDKIRMDVKGVEAFLLGDAGILSLAKQSRARAQKTTAAQNIPDATWTKIELTDEDYDEQNEFDPTTNYRFTAKTAGYYFVAGNVTYSEIADGKKYITAIKKNTTIIALGRGIAGGTGTCGSSASTCIYLAINDYLELWTYQDSGAAKDTLVNDGYQQMAVHKLS